MVNTAADGAGVPDEELLESFRSVRFDALTQDELTRWARLRHEHEAFRSPFFHPGFSRAVHASGHPVTVLLGGMRDGAPALVWPLHARGTVLEPVAEPGADHQGPIGLAPFDPVTLLRQSGMRNLTFSHLSEANPSLTPHVRDWHESPVVHVKGGLDGYLTRARKSGRDSLSAARRKSKRAVAEYGELRFTPMSDDPRLLDELIRHKREQYGASGSRDYFAVPSRRRLLHELLAYSDRDFRGVLSAVHCGDTLLAAHFGIQSDDVLHWWIPVYVPAMSPFNPGWLLLRELIQAAEHLGMEEIDLGRGQNEYKRRLMTGYQRVGEGIVSRSRLDTMQHASTATVRDLVRQSGLAPKIRRLVRS
jgi:CelD/BcsL family acetyltransferase involved in cellulose biosynthesis